MRNYSIKKMLGLLVLLSLMSVGQASATVIRENVAGTATSLSGYWGQSVVTGAGGSWDNIEFNFFNANGEHAFGNIFLLSQAYLSTPSALSNATVGYIAQASASGGKYIFDSAVTLLSSTTYWFYTDATSAGVLVGNTPSGVAGENHYFTSAAGGNFNGPFAGVNYRLAANNVPEPATLALFGLGLAGLGFSRRKNA